MKYTFATEINLPNNKVVELFLDKNNLKEWQKELLSYENISGIPNDVGAVTKLVYKSVTIFETINSKDLPNEIKGFYEHKAGKKTVMVHHTSHRFRQLSENKTLFELEMQDVKFIGLLPKLMSKLMGGMFERYHQNQVDQFKAFAETKTTQQ
jgi:Zn-dependent M16 (insulinase) family peptidase